MFLSHLRENGLHSGLVWPVLCHILSEYGDLSVSVHIQSKCEEKSGNTDPFHTVVRFCGS